VSGRAHESVHAGLALKMFCGLDKRWGVCGETPALFVCDDCIALMVDIRRTELGDAWPPLE